MINGRHLLTQPIAICAAAALVAPAIADDKAKPTDIDITIAIETELALDDATPAHRIDVTTTKGIVTLTGSVDNLLAKERAVKRAAATRGVRSVIDRVSVAPSDRSDSEIRQDVTAALLADPATDSYEILVDVSKGVVTLNGAVDSWQERRLAATVAKGVRGVTDVDNKVAVEYALKRSDHEIKADVQRRLQNHIQVDAGLLKVEVKDGKVTLTGVAGSDAEKRRASALAWVAGVKDVTADGVNVEWWAEDPMRRKGAPPIMTDEEIASAAKDALVYDPRVFSFNVNVHVKSGVATLTGEVDNLKAKLAAADTVENTVGVWRVKNHVRVRPATMPTDAVIAERVRSALTRDPYVDKFDVDVRVQQGRAILTGEVNNRFERQWAADVASRINGVIEVDNNLTFVHDWAWRPDQEIRQDVESQLFWSPFVDSSDIDVKVEHGIVTLTGAVDDWMEWRAATENAFEGNAKDVRNDLIIRGD